MVLDVVRRDVVVDDRGLALVSIPPNVSRLAAFVLVSGVFLFGMWQYGQRVDESVAAVKHVGKQNERIARLEGVIDGLRTDLRTSGQHEDDLRAQLSLVIAQLEGVGVVPAVPSPSIATPPRAPTSTSPPAQGSPGPPGAPGSASPPPAASPRPNPPPPTSCTVDLPLVGCVG